jgi:hypothetical protein
MIKITPKFSTDDIKKMLVQRKQAILDAITQRLQFVGEQFVIDARNSGSYKDRTGNLRGSIGYVILYNGAQLTGNFDGTVDGVVFAKKAIADIKEKYPTGFVLIGVAGMDYAAAVEAKGYDVISSSSIKATEELKKALQKLNEKIK